MPVLARWFGDSVLTRPSVVYLEEALEIHRRNGDAWGIARSTFMIGYIAIETGDLTRPVRERHVVDVDGGRARR